MTYSKNAGFVIKLLLLVASSVPLARADGATDTLTVRVDAFRSDRGHAVANLFNEGQNVFKIKEAYRRSTVVVQNRQAVFSFSELPYGKYALSVFHDENDNAELDHRFGMPAEPLAFSNDFHLSLFSGFPSFEKLKFTFGPDSGALIIRID